MRILLLDQYSDRGGGQRMLLETLCAIRGQGWQAIVGLPGKGCVVEQVERLGFETAAIGCGPLASGRKSAADALRFLREMPKLAGEIAGLAARFAPNVIYINGPRILPGAALARVTAPVLFHAHVAPPAAQRWLAGAALGAVGARVVAVSRMIAEAWRPFARVQVIHNGVEGPRNSAPRRREGPPRIGCIGRISREKGQREFLAAAAAILRAIPAARFFVYGAPLFGDAAALRYEQEVRAAAQGMPVEFCGWVDDVQEAFANLDLLLVPSVWREPSPLVILEAFAAGVPAIAFRAGSIPEFLDQVCDTPAEMARMAVEILSDPAHRRALAAAGREVWRERYHPDRYRGSIASAIREAAERQ